MREVESLIEFFARLPGLGPRSARRVVLKLLQRRDALLRPLLLSLRTVDEHVGVCSVCGNFDTHDPCTLCQNPERDQHRLCIVETVGDLWALERTRTFSGRYHVLGGVLAPLEGVGPEDLNVESLFVRLSQEPIQEVILATNLTMEGQSTAHYLTEQLSAKGVKMTTLRAGIPFGGELEYLDDGTLTAAFASRQTLLP